MSNHDKRHDWPIGTTVVCSEDGDYANGRLTVGKEYTIIAPPKGVPPKDQYYWVYIVQDDGKINGWRPSYFTLAPTKYLLQEGDFSEDEIDKAIELIGEE
jgi:hypothetical protein